MNTVNYPGNVEAVGQVVGPNHLGEFFVGVNTEFTLHRNGKVGDPRHDTTRVDFELLTKEREALLTTEAKRDFVAMTNSRKAAEEKLSLGGPVIEWQDMVKFKQMVCSPHLWFVS